ncbi:MAG: formylglycine-generating enzyme family protein, partial [Planctomycetaceae bacterium]
DEAVNLNSSLGLKTERAVLHVKLGEQAVAKQDYAAAATELNSAVSLDKSATGVVALAVSVSEPVVVAYEQDPTSENLTAAIAAWRSVSNLDATAPPSAELMNRLITLLSRPVLTYEQDPTGENLTAAVAAWRSVSQLDATAPPTVELMNRVITLLSRPVLAFEQDPTVENLTAALAAIGSIESVDAGISAAWARGRVKAAALKRGESVADNDPDSALKAYEAALSLGASSSDSLSLKGQLVTALTARCRQSLSGWAVSKATADYVALRKLDPQTTGGLIADFEKLISLLPASEISQLPASLLLLRRSGQNSIGMEFKLLPSGTFRMGRGSRGHQRTLTKSFELGVYEVTQEQYQKVMGTNPSAFKRKPNPVESVSWNDAVEFCRNLSVLPAEKSAGYVYRLPTGAEWEYGCRAGTTTEYSFGDNQSKLGEYAWYGENSGDTTHPVGQKKPNPWGIYDMHGNVWEWCQDEAAADPSGSVTDQRGGSCSDTADFCLSSIRLRIYPSNRRVRHGGRGFRVVRSSIR